MATQVYTRSRQPSQTTLRAQALLGRYPNVSEREIAELINLLPYVPMLDYGLMTADDRLSGKLAGFHQDHGHKLKVSRASLMLFMAFPAMVAIGALWWALS